VSPIPKFLSAQQRYKETIAKLVNITDDEVQRHMFAISHDNPASLAWAVAQRGSSGLNIEASVEYVSNNMRIVCTLILD
jgi:hypothetical protein